MSETPQSSNFEHELTSQTQIVAQLLSQQPTVVQASVIGKPAPTLLQTTTPPEVSPADYANFLMTIQAMQASIACKDIVPLLNPVKTEVSEEVTPKVEEVEVKEEVRFSDSPSSNSTGTASQEPEYKPRNVREKVYADGFIMSFDKRSSCGTKEFWRCERKNDCNARMHCDKVTRRITRKLHPHNHERPSAEELAFYDQDFSVLDPEYCHPVKSINRSYMARKISRDSQAAAHAKMIQQQQQQQQVRKATESMSISELAQQDPKKFLSALNAAAMAAATMGPATSSPQKVSTSPQKVSSVSNIQPIRLKRHPRKTEEEELDEEFMATYALAKKLMCSMRPQTEIAVKWLGSPESLLIFLSSDNGATENVFFPTVLLKRDEKSLQKAVESFAGKRCEGSIAASFSDKVNVLVHEAMLSTWPHGKLFLVNSDEAKLWRLTPIDAHGEVIHFAH